MKQPQGWDLEAWLKSPQMLRIADLFCFACMVFDALVFDLVVGWVLR